MLRYNPRPDGRQPAPIEPVAISSSLGGRVIRRLECSDGVMPREKPPDSSEPCTSARDVLDEVSASPAGASVVVALPLHGGGLREFYQSNKVTVGHVRQIIQSFSNLLEHLPRPFNVREVSPDGCERVSCSLRYSCAEAGSDEFRFSTADTQFERSNWCMRYSARNRTRYAGHRDEIGRSKRFAASTGRHPMVTPFQSGRRDRPSLRKQLAT